MTKINNLTIKPTLESDDRIPIWDTSNSRTRSVEAHKVKEYCLKDIDSTINEEIDKRDFATEDFAKSTTYEQAGYPWAQGQTSVKDRIYNYQPDNGPAIKVYDPVGGNLLGIQPDLIVFSILNLTPTSLADYASLNYKSSQGKSAVENMISGNPLQSSVGDVCTTGATVWKRVRTLAGDISDFEPISEIYSEDFGEGLSGFNSANTHLNSLVDGGSLTVSKTFTSPSGLTVKPKVRVTFCAPIYFTSGASDSAMLTVDGGYAVPSYDPLDHFLLHGRTWAKDFIGISTDIETGVEMLGVEVVNSAGTKVINSLTFGANLGGVKGSSGYEVTIETAHSYVSLNRAANSIGLHVTTSDGHYSNIIPCGYHVGCKNEGTANNLTNVHPWGNSQGGSVGYMGKMHVGFYIASNGGYSNYRGCYSDTAVRIDPSQPPGRANGAVGWVIDGWQSTLNGCLNNCNSSSPDENGISMILGAQRCTIDGFNDSQPSKVQKPFVVFENGASPLNNEIKGGDIGYNLSGSDGYYTIDTNFITSYTSRSYRQDARSSMLSMSIRLQGTMQKPANEGDALTISIPEFADTLRFRTSCPYLLYAFRGAAGSKTPVDIVTEPIAGPKIGFRMWFSDGTSTQITGLHINNGEGITVDLNIDASTN